jgi:mRNA deadenylase 3'-5' endonuclease subunit Ccr4
MAPVSSSATNDATSSSYSRADVDDPSSLLEFNIASLNILAESYLTPRSHPGLPEQYANVAFDTTKRRQLLLDTLERFCGPSRSDNNKDDDVARKWDILALQELDLIAMMIQYCPRLKNGVTRLFGQRLTNVRIVVLLRTM